MLTTIMTGACLLAGHALAQGDVKGLLEVEKDFMFEQDARGRFPPSAYVSDFPLPEDSSGSYAISELVNDNPLFATLPNNGMGFVMFHLEPCAMNQPHQHPRATEWAFVIEGSLEMGVAEENGGGEAIINTVTVGKAMIFPQGLIHWQINDNCQPATFVSSLNHRDPGVSTVAQRILEVPDKVLRGVIGIDDDESLSDYRSMVGAVPLFPTDPACVKRCGLGKSGGYY